MMGLGNEPVGECYYIPPDISGVSWLVGHYYSGGEVKLIQFRPTVESPEDGSPIKRIENLEDWMQYSYKLFEQIKDMYAVIQSYMTSKEAWDEAAFKVICDNLGLPYESVIEPGEPKVDAEIQPEFEKFDEEGKIPEYQADIETQIGNRGDWYPTDAPYMISNAETMSAKRGW